MAGLIPYGHNKVSRHDPFDLGFWDGGWMRNMFKDSAFGSFDVDVKDKGDHYEIDADLPGLHREMIDISLADGYLTITANQDEEHNEEKDGFVLHERRSGKVTRSFMVGDVQEDKIAAKYKDGVLKITLPKNDKPKEKQLKIDVK